MSDTARDGAGTDEGGDGTKAPRRARTKRGPLGNAVELIVTVVVAVGLALLVQAFIVKPYRIPSGSMLNTLQIGQRILVSRFSTHPGIGDIVVFHPPTGADENDPMCGNPNQGPGKAQPCDKAVTAESSQTFVKRVVGLPGDHLLIRNGEVWRNGVQERAPYALACGGGLECTFTESITVPAGEYYMMGDNRGDSLDSRFWGPVPQRWIIGTAFFTYWPISRIGTL